MRVKEIKKKKNWKKERIRQNFICIFSSLIAYIEELRHWKLKVGLIIVFENSF